MDDYVHHIGYLWQKEPQVLLTSYFSDEDKGIAKDMIDFLLAAKQEVPALLRNMAEC